ncbi:acyl-CoA thioesterase [Bacillus cereus group sp. Bc222]|uniref:acyl-CoA thioesterase n=1 Tax=Bacillus cereus group sp. Bc222 TaxID=3018111 RepID=UPI0022E50AEA|nr:acyl-CoA thioesterase [Bacillus cereus group sp. Bc222]MDA2242332.1 acyl-CoA thioesterase [Bacillus cereus group sp. Bc222]
MKMKLMRESKVTKTLHVFPSDLNNHHTLFGGKLLADIDNIASISATKHSRRPCVTASIDSVSFVTPIYETDIVCYEAYVCNTKRSSMEIFTKVIAEDLSTGKRRIAATCFATFVAIKGGKACPVPPVCPETEEEFWLYETGTERLKQRELNRLTSKEMTEALMLEEYRANVEAI